MTDPTDINLIPFCATNRLDLMRPMTINGCDVVATNRHIFVVALDHPDADEFPVAYPNVYPQLLNFLKHQTQHAPYRSDQPSTRLDAMQLNPTPDCQACNGIGFLSEAKGHWCPDCFGMGVQCVPIAVGAAHFQLHYLNLMRAHLPHCTLQLPADDCLGYPVKTTPFVFEGGYGWLAACDPKKVGATT